MKCSLTTWFESFSAVTGTFLRLSHGAIRQHVTTTNIQKTGDVMTTLHISRSGCVVRLNTSDRRMNNAQNRPIAAHPQKRLVTGSQH